MEDDFEKRNTDCVYFLASPLTCKKGVDCEYRHNEIARLNPRECWYWVSSAAGCLNPTCAFRHPPLDGRPETASVSATSHHQFAAPANKTNVLCHFYFNGHCNKGERCFYLHGPEDTMPKRIASKTASSTAFDSEKKTSVCCDNGSAPVETESFGIVSEKVTGTKIKPEKVLCQTHGDNVAELNVSPQVSSPPLGETATTRSNSSVPEEASLRSLILIGESTDDQELDPIEREDWLESSPGFDVLVNNSASEDFIYEDDARYLIPHNVEDPENYDQLLGYDYEDKIEYDPAYPDLGVSFEQAHSGFMYVDDENIHKPVNYCPFYEKERALDHTYEQKGNHFEADLGSKCHSGGDLRDYLRKRRVIDGKYPIYPEMRERSAVLPRRHLQGRLSSKIESHSVGSRIGRGTRLNGIHKPARQRTRVGRSRHHHFREKRSAKQQNLLLLSEVYGKKTSRKRSAEKSGSFSGPKTLAQIKEEKRKAQGNGDCSTC